MNEYKPEVLTDMPGKNAVSSAPPMTSSAASSSNGTDQVTSIIEKLNC
jgi:hypothetical protein